MQYESFALDSKLYLQLAKKRGPKEHIIVLFLPAPPTAGSVTLRIAHTPCFGTGLRSVHKQSTYTCESMAEHACMRQFNVIRNCNNVETTTQFVAGGYNLTNKKKKVKSTTDLHHMGAQAV